MTNCVAAYELVHIENVGTGFNGAETASLRKMLDKLRWKQRRPPTEPGDAREVVWVQPMLIAEIEFRAWTADGKLRDVSYNGLRERQENAGVFRLD